MAQCRNAASYATALDLPELTVAGLKLLGGGSLRPRDLRDEAGEAFGDGPDDSR
jgi:hypothetical protein